MKIQRRWVAQGVAAVLGCTLQAAFGSVTAQDADALADLQQQESERDNVFEAYFPDMDTARRAAISFHAQLLESNYSAGYLVLELDADDQQRLRAFGFELRPALSFIRRRNAMIERLRAAGPQATLLGRQALPPTEVGGESIPSFPCYETVEETFAAAAGFATTYPTLATWTSVGRSWEKANGLGGYDIGVLKLTNSAVSGPKPKLFINAAIHAREYATAPLVLAFATQLLTGYGTDADATWLLDNHEIHLLLQTNPDGRKKAESGLLWRKNTNQAYCGAKSNDRGADLNRNFTFNWNITHGQGSSGNVCDETYRGPTAGSEPETQAIQDYVRSLWPDRRGTGVTDPAPADTSGLHLDIHSYGDLVLWPWGSTNTPSGNATALQTLGRKFAFFNNYTPMQAIGLYPTDGTSDGVSYGELGVAAYTFELGTTFFQSCSSYTQTIKPQNLAALLYAAKVVRTPYETPAGPDLTALKLGNRAATKGVRAGTPVSLKGSATDTRFNQTDGVEPTQAIAAAEYYVDVPPWLPGAVAVPIDAADGRFDAKTEKLKATVDTTGLASGRHMLFARAKDAGGAWGAFSASFLVIK